MKTQIRYLMLTSLCALGITANATPRIRAPEETLMQQVCVDGYPDSTFNHEQLNGYCYNRFTRTDRSVRLIGNKYLTTTSNDYTCYPSHKRHLEITFSDQGLLSTFVDLLATGRVGSSFVYVGTPEPTILPNPNYPWYDDEAYRGHIEKISVASSTIFVRRYNSGLQVPATVVIPDSRVSSTAYYTPISASAFQGIQDEYQQNPVSRANTAVAISAALSTFIGTWELQNGRDIQNSETCFEAIFFRPEMLTLDNVIHFEFAYPNPFTGLPACADYELPTGYLELYSYSYNGQSTQPNTRVTQVTNDQGEVVSQGVTYRRDINAGTGTISEGLEFSGNTLNTSGMLGGGPGGECHYRRVSSSTGVQRGRR